MPFTQIDDTPLRAENLSRTGAVLYQRWRDSRDNSYVQITDVAGGHGVGNGTFSKYLFALDEIGAQKSFTGYHPTNGSTVIVSDNNMSGFLRAVRDDIFRREDEQTKSDGL